jgi:hypothetical protein
VLGCPNDEQEREGYTAIIGHLKPNATEEELVDTTELLKKAHAADAGQDEDEDDDDDDEPGTPQTAVGLRNSMSLAGTMSSDGRTRSSRTNLLMQKIQLQVAKFSVSFGMRDDSFFSVNFGDVKLQTSAWERGAILMEASVVSTQTHTTHKHPFDCDSSLHFCILIKSPYRWCGVCRHFCIVF